MLKKLLFVFVAILFLSENVFSKPIVDCRAVYKSVESCNPYGLRLLKAKEISYAKGRKKLHITRTLPIPEKKSIKVISVNDMFTSVVEKYMKTNIEIPLRFKNETIDLHVRDTNISNVKDVVVVQEEEPKVLAEVTQKQVNIVKSQDTRLQDTTLNEGIYRVVSGDIIGRIAHKFNMKTKTLLDLNGLDKKSTLHIGQKIKIPLAQNIVDAMGSGEYRIESGDTLLSIAYKFDLEPKDLVKFNNIKSTSIIRKGKTLLLPLPYVVKKLEAERKKALALENERALAEKKRLAKQQKLKYLKAKNKRKLRVTATAYTSHKNQTDSTPFIAAWNNRLRPGMKIIAVSRDLLTRYGLRNGTKVRISGLRGYYTVRDKMNKRYKKRIDIYMGLNKKRALRWGRRSVVIKW
ncbi:MAG: Membrane-bound lytic murein transglycosylase D precursor (EC [uncultured Sulfurovum sp.]|uniref:Membrane-bound lytic murein transglycosylase D (EC) n=1 Tax=uncultured Sulfurovum sp. TaxID=269237 RepID=A0A6S6SHP9_9BACT|nr:MAG: Membrane-bound lytic murein transglycosylase D precursor (EC [uncultured Sulfurovum sp.]